MSLIGDVLDRKGVSLLSVVFIWLIWTEIWHVWSLC